MAERPRIGITMRLELETRRFYLGRDYSEALVAAGALPVHIPLIPDVEYIAELVDGLDGILLPGADCDPDPAYYGEEPHPKLKKVIPEKDETDILVLAEADSRGLPVLGICFGMQILNVSRGGSLIQDIESQIESPVKHDQGVPLDRNSHRIGVKAGSRLAGIAGQGIEEIMVNSHHHQSVNRCGRDLVPTASASDGVIECIEEPGNRFVVGVQWHPELAWRTDDVSRKIFDAFVDAARERIAVA
ncbi:MAG: gamma-glutamyl-gamma-aminobutyrate hydrolase family protein [Pyrinomonadaceae bacterium]|nr:gamma-glutamyl-gamma-aminobutyrate hydrolase family protein [Pyrinomonadaceae bacterium]